MSYETEKLKIKIRKSIPFLCLILTVVLFFIFSSCQQKYERQSKYKVIRNKVQQPPFFMNPPKYIIGCTDGTTIYVSIEDYALCKEGDSISVTETYYK